MFGQQTSINKRKDHTKITVQIQIYVVKYNYLFSKTQSEQNHERWSS